MSVKNEILIIKDDDGDTLDVKEVFGFGEPMMSVFVTNPDDEQLCGMNLSLPNAIKVVARLNEFINRDYDAEYFPPLEESEV